MSARKKYQPIQSLLDEQSAFFEKIAKRTCEVILEKHKDVKHLQTLLDGEVSKEELRVRRSTWKVDKVRGEKAFWERIRKQFTAATTPKVADDQYKELLNTIIYHYLEEMMYSYSRAFAFVASIFCSIGILRLLTSIKSLSGWILTRSISQLQILGHSEHARKLSDIGTVMLLPTHFSQIDSFIVGLTARYVGFPPILFGAGLNLFSSPFFSYFAGRVGAYRIDRRKKGLIYLQTLHHFSKGVCKFGCSSLVFPGGGRTRTGHVGVKLKLGLLNATITAQRELCLEKSIESAAKKVFLIPVVINYKCVPDAPGLMREYATKPVADHQEKEHSFTFFRTCQTIFRYLIKETSISVSFGRALDVAGNYVNEDGQSVREDGTSITVEDYFTQNGEIVSNKTLEHAYAQHLSQQILKEYSRNNAVFFDHVVAFVAFELFAKQHKHLNEKDLLQVAPDNTSIDYGAFEETTQKVAARIQVLHADNVLRSTNLGHKDISTSIFRAVNDCGAYYPTRTLFQAQKGADIFIKNVHQLYYYRNLLVEYGLEACF